MLNNDFSMHEDGRRGIEGLAAWIYYILSVANGIVMFALVWRIDNLTMKIWAVIAAFAIIASSIIWLKANNYAAMGKQLIVARVFLGLDWIIAILNTVSLFYLSLAPEEAQTAMYGIFHYWNIVGAGAAVIIALIGVGFLVMFSPDRFKHDMGRLYQHGLYNIVKKSLTSGDVPDDIRDKMIVDGYTMFRNIAFGIGAQSVNATRGNQETVKRPSLWDMLPNAMQNTQSPQNGHVPQNTQIPPPETPSAQGIPLLIPAAKRAELVALGYTQDEIARMSPTQARAILSEWATEKTNNGASTFPNA